MIDEIGHGPQVDNPSPFITYSAPANTDHAWRSFIFAVVGILFCIGSFYLAYVLCLKDLLLTLKAKKQRTTTEIGFGNTPARPVERNGSGIVS